MAKDAEGDADDIVDGLPLTALGGLSAVDADLEAVAADSGGLFLAQLTTPAKDDLFGQVNERAVAYARDRAAELVSDIEDSTRNDLRGIIAAGLKENIGMDAIAGRIEDAYAFSEERADLIAHNEIAMANSQGVLEGMHSARNAGVALKKVWLPDADACDICEENGDAGPIDLDDDFPSGDDAPTAHVNCRCTMASDIEEDAEGDDE